jgi:hypothetical protein
MQALHMSHGNVGKNKCTRCFMKSCCCCIGKRTPFQAVSDVWYHIDSNHLFCLLGHNGAGKVRAHDYTYANAHTDTMRLTRRVAGYLSIRRRRSTC